MSAAPEIAKSMIALDGGIETLQRHVVDVDDRHAVEIFEARPQRDHLEKVRHHLHVHREAARAVEQLDHAQVLIGRQRHVQMIDALARRDVGGFVDAFRAAGGPDSQDDRRWRDRRRNRRSDSRARDAR